MLLIMDVKIKCIWIFLTNVFIKATIYVTKFRGGGQKERCCPRFSQDDSYNHTLPLQFMIPIDGWSCVSTMTKTFSRVNTDAVLHFDLSGYVDQNTGISFPVKFYDNSVQALVIFNNGVITTDTLPGVEVTADISGNIAVTKENIEINNAGVYYISSTTIPTRCSCLYILGTPTQPSVSVTGSPSVGGGVILTCSSTSTTTPSNHSLSFMYSWRVGSTDNPSGSSYLYSTNRNTLTLSDIVKDDANKQFTCTATENVSGGYTSSRSDSKSLNIYFGPDTVNISVQSPVRFAEGDIAQDIRCSAECNPGCSYMWTNVTDSSRISSNYLLSLGRVDRFMTGSYMCTVNNTSPQYPRSTENIIEVFVTYTHVQSFYLKEHPGQDKVTVDEHDAHIEFKCIIDSNSASKTKITFEGNLIKVGVNVTLLSVSRKDVSCYDTGVYICEGMNDNGKISSKKIFLSVRCVPRPLDKVQRNVTSELHSSITLSFTAIAYPEPDPKGFAWHKEEDVGWVPLLSNNHLKISSSGLQSNLTVQNVSKEDYGNYRLTVTNDIGTYVQHFFLSGRMSPDHINSQCNCQQSERATLIVGITLGVVCCALASVAFYLNILRMRANAKEKGLPNRSKKQSTFANPSFASDVVEHQEYENAATDQGEAIDQQQYTDLSRYANTEKDMYDVLKKT